MKKTSAAILCALALSLAGNSVFADSLDEKSRSIVAISAYTAQGDMEKLDASLVRGLEAGLTVSEIKEVLVQLYAYTGFPRSLNAIHRFMDVTKRRAEASIKDEPGKEPSPVPAGINKDEYGAKVRAKLGGRTEIPPPAGYQVFAPVIDTFLKEHLFCDIFIRDNLSPKYRELATIGALGAMTGTAGQLNFHLGAALNTGTTVEEMEDYFAEIERAAGEEQEKIARDVLANILAKRKAS